jgi:hypothetical protein
MLVAGLSLAVVALGAMLSPRLRGVGVAAEQDQ